MPDTSAEMRQAAESTNLMGSIIYDWAKSKGFNEDWELAKFLSTASNRLLNTDTGETIWMSAVIDGAETEFTFCDMLGLASDALYRNVIAAKLMLIVTEVAEAMESLRETGHSNIQSSGNFVEELADIEIRVKHLAAQLKLDLGQAEIDKIIANTDRPHKHGKKM